MGLKQFLEEIQECGMTLEQVKECGEEAYRASMLCGRSFKAVYQEYCTDNEIKESFQDSLACLYHYNKLIDQDKEDMEENFRNNS